MQASRKSTSATDAQQLLAANNPGQRWAISEKHNAIGVWSDSLGRYVAVCLLDLFGQWNVMQFEIRANGKLTNWNWQAVEGGAA